MNLQQIFDCKVIVRFTDGTETSDIEVKKIKTADTLRVTVKNDTDKALSVKEIVLFSGRTGVKPQTKFYSEGYHMLSQYRGTLNDCQLIGAYGNDKDFFHLPDNPYDKDLFIGYYLLHLMEEAEDTLLGFSSCYKFLGKFRFKEDYLEIVADCEDILLYPGQVWDMEELTIIRGKKSSGLFAKLASYINKNHPPMHISQEKIPTGWCSYYCMGQMHPEDLYKNAKAMAKHIPELEMIQVDAGTNTTDGDWLIPRFSDDLEAICGKIRKEGVQAGGYMSPFLVNIDSKLCAEHKDWLVKDEDGNPTNRCSHNKAWYILDGTHPEARAYLKKVVRYMHDECQLRYFKLDFIAYGSLPAGRRYDRSKTSVEAYRMAMTAILEEVAGDSFVLACNAPFWPTLGLCHGNRTTNDIFRDWKHVEGNALEQFYRNWQHRTLWINDPDCILLEKLDIVRFKNGQPSPRPCTLTDDEFEFHKAFAVACGGMILSGDLLYELSEKNIEILKKMKNAMGEAAVFDDDSFTIGRFPTKKLICVFNWKDEEQVVNIPINQEGDCVVLDFWSGDSVGTFKDSIEITLPAHRGRVLKI